MAASSLSLVGYSGYSGDCSVTSAWTSYVGDYAGGNGELSRDVYVVSSSDGKQNKKTLYSHISEGLRHCASAAPFSQSLRSHFSCSPLLILFSFSPFPTSSSEDLCQVDAGAGAG